MKRNLIPPQTLVVRTAALGRGASLLALALMLPACAHQVENDTVPPPAAAMQSPLSGESPLPDSASTPAGAAEQPAAPAPGLQPAVPDDAVGPADTASSATQPPLKTPYAFVCVPYDDRPRPRHKVARKEAPPPAPPASAAPAAAPEQKPGSPVISILGKKVFGRDGDDMGRVVDVLADHDGRARAAIIDFGGFLGVGNRRVAVDWPSLQIDPANPDKPVVLSLSRDQVKAAPEFKESAHPEQAIVSDPPSSTPAAPASPQ